jgi:hypothetical protein
MSQLKLYGMKAAYDEIITTAVKRQHEPQQIVGDLLNAEIDQVTSWLATEILALSEFLTSYWEEIDDAMFERLWQTEVDAVPEFTTSKITLICGLLLPIWDRLGSDATNPLLPVLKAVSAGSTLSNWSFWRVPSALIRSSFWRSLKPPRSPTTGFEANELLRTRKPIFPV